jgi:hypothetical protein
LQDSRLTQWRMNLGIVTVRTNQTPFDLPFCLQTQQIQKLSSKLS